MYRMPDLIPMVVPIQKEETPSESGVNLNFGNLIGNNNENTLPLPDPSTPLPLEEDTSKKKKRTTRRRINTSTGEETDSEHEPYKEQFNETNAMLRTAIVQADASLADLQSDIKQIRNSRTLRKKYDYLSMMQGTVGQFINTKVTAIREMNSVIAKCNELELRRARDLKAAESAQNDDKTIMDMYNAFIHTPVSAGMTLGPNMQEISTGGIPTINTALPDEDMGYQNYLNNLNPAEKLMMYENDPDVQQVVMYDESTGARWFEIMNLRTNEVIQGADKHDNMFLEDVVFDDRNGIAKNLNLNETYPIIRVGNSVVNNY